MKIKHNKKRNTAFIYEALVNEATVAMLKGDSKARQTSVSLIKKHFQPGSLLRCDLECYRSLTETRGVSATVSRRLLHEATNQRRALDKEKLFKSQSVLIKEINTELGPHVFKNFVPNYRNLATIAQLFSMKSSPRAQIMLENELLQHMQAAREQSPSVDPVDNVVYRKFVKKFNTKYETELLDEQKELLSYYISSFADNAVELKMFLNEEILRLKESLRSASATDEVAADPEMINKTNLIITKLDSFATATVNEKLLLTVLKTQQLVKEIYNNGDID